MTENAKRRTPRGSRLLTLKREQAAYDANLSSWLTDHEGEYVLIKGKTVDGFYVSRDDALVAGYSRFGIGPLFVKQVMATEPNGINFSQTIRPKWITTIVKCL